jgi:hypothetical protein
VVDKLRQKGVHLSDLPPLQLSSALVPTMLDEFWIMRELSFDFLLQAIDLLVDGLRGRIVCQLRSVGERLMCAYGALSEFRTEANGSSVKLRRIVSVAGGTWAQISFGIAA